MTFTLQQALGNVLGHNVECNKVLNLLIHFIS